MANGSNENERGLTVVNATTIAGEETAGPVPGRRRISREKLTRWFILSAGVILALTGTAKVFGAVGGARALDVQDPILGMPFRYLMAGVGLTELLVAFFCLFTHKRNFSLVAVAWLATNFLFYRLGLWWIGWHRPCGCMGNLTDVLHISAQTADWIMKGLLAYLLAGSGIGILGQRGFLRKRGFAYAKSTECHQDSRGGDT